MYADSAWQETQVQLRAVPGDAQRQMIGALALAYQGRKQEAIALGLQGLGLSPISRDGVTGPYYQQIMARFICWWENRRRRWTCWSRC